MHLATGILSVLTLAVGLPSSSRITLLAPPSRAGHVLEVRQWGRPGVMRVTEPGTHSFEVQCSHVRGESAVLTLEVEETAVPPLEAPWTDYTPEQLRSLAREGARDGVQLTDSLARTQLQPEAVALPGGGWATLRFETAGGVVCLVPDRLPAQRQNVEGTERGDTLVLRGRLVGTFGADPVLVVQEVRPPAGKSEAPETRWTVTARWEGAEAARITAPGAYPLSLPCPHRPGTTERVGLGLRRLRLVDLTVKGRKVVAELADTPAGRSWGLQGRAGLAEDEGMLFFFPHPGYHRFTMKTVSFPLSIAFIQADGTLVHIAQLPPGGRGLVGPPVPVNYVLEMRRGWFAEHGVAPGDTVEMP